MSDLPDEKLATQPTGIKLEEKKPHQEHWVYIGTLRPIVSCTRLMQRLINQSRVRKDRLTSTIYDPLGLITPITLIAKLFMEE